MDLKLLKVTAIKNIVPCRACSVLTCNSNQTCEKCYKDPDTNNCGICDLHLQGIPYSYICYRCFEKYESARK